MKSFISKESIVLLVILLSAICLVAEAQQCDPSGQIRGTQPPPGQCNQENGAVCCEEGKMYPTYKCSPPLSRSTEAILTLNSFQEGGDGGDASNCDGQYYDDNTPVVALSTGWFDNKGRCFNNITISDNNGRSVVAMVVDECDSAMGCDAAHGYQIPCENNIVDASKAVWDALGVPKDQQGRLDITWSDA